LGKNPPLQLLQLGARLDSKLFHQQLARPPIERQGISLMPHPVEREHQLAAEPLTFR
jgi:hypothetical protein